MQTNSNTVDFLNGGKFPKLEYQPQRRIVVKNLAFGHIRSGRDVWYYVRQKVGLEYDV